MKKLLTVFAVAGMFTFIACGPSAEEKAKIEQARQDSIKAAEEAARAVEQARQDSIRMVEEAAKAAEQARQDSIKKAEEEAKNKKPKQSAPKPKEVKPGQGKG
jgi:vacuolar-type H+-ATPase subunit H